LFSHMNPEIGVVLPLSYSRSRAAEERILSQPKPVREAAVSYY
jgi:hypothetical protein